MNEGTAIELAKYKMKELGVGKKYILRYRHFRLDADETKEIKGENHLYILITASYWVQEKSKAGIYNRRDTGINEHQHVHRGLIELKNQGRWSSEIRFIQVIPILKKNK